MADIGYMGEIPFTTSAEKIRTFSDFSRKGDPRLGTHDIIGVAPYSIYSSAVSRYRRTNG